MKKSIVASVRTLLGRASQGAERSNGSNDGLAEVHARGRSRQQTRGDAAEGSVMCDTQGAPTSRAADETDCSRRRGRAGTAARLHSDCFAQSRPDPVTSVLFFVSDIFCFSPTPASATKELFVSL